MKRDIRVVVTLVSFIVMLLGCSGETGGNDNTSPEGGYNVYGVNEAFQGGIEEMKNYTFLGDSTVTEVFAGSYPYYVIGNDGDGSAIQIDAIQGSNDVYYSSIASSNTGDSWTNLAGAPDGVYVTISANGYVLIDASNDQLDSIQVFTD